MKVVPALLLSSLLGSASALAALRIQPKLVFPWLVTGLVLGAILGAPLGFITRRRWRVAWLSSFPVFVGAAGPALVYLVYLPRGGDGLSAAAFIAAVVATSAALAVVGALYGLAGLWGESTRRWIVGAVSVALAAAALAMGYGHWREQRTLEAARRTQLEEDPLVLIDPTGTAEAPRGFRLVRVDASQFPPAPPTPPTPQPESCGLVEFPEKGRARRTSLPDPGSCVFWGCPDRDSHPLIDAARAGEASAVKRLLRKGMDPNTCIHYGEGSAESALEAAIGAGDLQNVRTAGHDEVVRILLEAGAHPNGAPVNSPLPLDLAREKSHEEAIELLESAGARPAPPPPPNVRDMARLPALLSALDSGDSFAAHLIAEDTQLDMASESCDVLGAAARSDEIGVLIRLFRRPQPVRVRCLETAHRQARSGTASARLLEHLLMRSR